MSVSSYAQFIYFRYAGFSSLRRYEDLFYTPVLFLSSCFYLCVSELASVQMRVLYDEHLIIAVLNAIV